MASTAAQDEFNTLVAPNAPRLRSHPSDATPRSRRSSSSSATLTASTIAPSTFSTPTITGRSSHRSRHSIASALHQPRPTSSGSFYHDSSSADEDDNEPETPDDQAHDSSDSDGEQTATKKGPSKYYLPTEWDRSAMTGPKGVIADAAAFEREKSGKRSSDFARTKDLKLPRAQQFGGSMSPKRRGQSASGSGSDGSEGEDRAVVAAWREQRLREMKAAREGMQSQMSGRKSSMQRGRDEVKVVNGNGFLEVVDKAGRGCTVVVLITDDDNPQSTAFSHALHTISRKYPSHSFISLSSSDADLDAAACPAVLGYRNGKQFAQIMPLADEVAITCNIVTNLEECLRGRDVLGSRFDIEGV